jgi:hypothetical protein
VQVTHRFLIFLSALVWYGGGVGLAWKGSALLLEANSINQDGVWSILAPLLGVVIGVIKAKFIFIKNCRKNITRINQLLQPKPWQFFRLRFMFILLIAITVGTSLSSMAHGHYNFLLLVGVIDISVAVALLVSSFVYWNPTYIMLSMNKVVVENHASDVVGRAVYAACDISVGETLIQSSHIKELGRRDRYSMERDGKHILISEPGVIVNHSCSPNCKVVPNSAGAFDFIALKEISKGTEITFDYLSNEAEVTAFTDCCCGSARCRRTMSNTKC